MTSKKSKRDNKNPSQLKVKEDVFESLLSFQKNILEKEPTLTQMWQEVRMMEFKIKPIHGDIWKINFQNKQFIRTLWNLGKLEEFFQRNYQQLKPNDKKIFFDFLDELYQRYQKQLNRLRFKKNQKLSPYSVLEMEIFRVKKQTKKTN